MALDAGTALGPYEILSPIGAGGMGEVYKARDTRLDRVVAIKVLPEHLAENAERKARFEREAKTISQLNHPHICTLHDVRLRPSRDEAGGFGGQVGETADIDYMVMEYIEGETLAERLERGALSLDEALKYASQIADGLDRAHRAGIVHRDLKPANVMLTAVGVKLLDFGLARPVAHEAAASGSDAPTLQRDLTREQAIIGTLPYMAPEQLEGKSQASLISAIMSTEPRSIRERQPSFPPLLERIVSTCLAKSPDERFQSARDVARALEWVAEPLDTARPPAKPRRAREAVAWVAILLLMTALALVLSADRTTETQSSTVRAVVNLPEDYTLQVISGVPFDISPDGRRLAFTASDPTTGWGQLFVRDLGDLEPKALTEPMGGIHQPFFSPDGGSVGFVTMDRNVVLEVPIDGGSPSKIIRLDTSPMGLEWLEDGSIVFGTNSGLWRVPEEGEPAEPLTQLRDGENWHHSPHALPDGQGVLFTVGRGGVSVAVQPARATEHRLLTEGRSGFYTPSGHLIFTSPNDGRVMAAPFDLDTLEITGPAVPMSDRAAQGPVSSFLAVSASGTMAYARALESPVTTVWANRDGEVQPVVEEGRFHSVRLSPDGSRFAADDLDSDRIWVYDLTRGTRLLLAEARNPLLPQWSPDGTEIAYGVGDGNIYIKSADGSGEARLFLERPETQWPLSFSPDGRWLAITNNTTERGRDILLVSRDGQIRVFADADTNENAAAFSPDGKWVAYQSDETGRPEVYVQPFPGPGPRFPISSNGGTAPVWSRDGSELFYRQGTALVAVPVSAVPSFTAGTATILFDGPFQADGSGHPSYDVAPGGERFLMMYREREQLTQLHVVVNATAELPAGSP